MTDDPVVSFIGARAKDQAEINAFLYEDFKTWYEQYLPPLLSEETKKLHQEALKSYRDFYAEVDDELGRHGDSAKLGNSNPKVGQVALYLHCLRQNGATYAELELQRDALRALAARLKIYDATTDPVVEAVLNAAKPQESN